MARKQYFGGDPQKVLDARVDHVLGLLHFEKFSSDYEDVYVELNKGG